jgi:hypothetical protein
VRDNSASKSKNFARGTVFLPLSIALSSYVDVLIYYIKVNGHFFTTTRILWTPATCVTIAVCLYAFWTSIWTTWVRSGSLNYSQHLCLGTSWGGNCGPFASMGRYVRTLRTPLGYGPGGSLQHGKL